MLKIGLYPHDRYFLFVSRFDLRKNIGGIIGAFKRAKSVFPGIKLVLAGTCSDEYFNELNKSASELFRSGTIIYVKATTFDDLLRLYSSGGSL